MPSPLPPDALAFLRAARVGHLATVDEQGRPSVVPVCFALHDFDIGGINVYSVIDAKPKRVPPERLRRLRNLGANPAASLVVDRWDEDWTRLGWVLLRGRGELVSDGGERTRAIALLREKYSQYRTMPLDDAPVIRLAVTEHHRWGDLSRPQFPNA